MSLSLRTNVARGLGGKDLITNAMTVDVEDYFQVGAFEKIINPKDWDSFPCHVEENIDRILTMFDDHNVKATFFTLGWIAQRYPEVVRRIIQGGHELASHGYGHLRVTDQSREVFLEDVSSAKKILEDIGGVQILGYRAPSFSIGDQNLWALDVLRETGHIYSSSIYPIQHDHYGMPSAPRFAFYPIDNDETFIEMPVTTAMVMGKKRPCGGGGFFRLLPYAMSRYAMEKVNKDDGQSCIFYFHPWEIDETQPRMDSASLKSKFRHYVNIKQMEPKIRKALRDFDWAPMAKVFLEEK
jgi:polysaccharide deacetylase family protein (PEP-CTERM system associated)